MSGEEQTQKLTSEEWVKVLLRLLGAVQKKAEADVKEYRRMFLGSLAVGVLLLVVANYNEFGAGKESLFFAVIAFLVAAFAKGLEMAKKEMADKIGAGIFDVLTEAEYEKLRKE